MPNFVSNGIGRRNMQNRSLLGKDPQGAPSESERCVWWLMASYIADKSKGTNNPFGRCPRETPEA
jgi:hypothetical protein